MNNWNLLDRKSKEYIVDLEFTEKTEHDLKMDKLVGFKSLNVNDYIERTYNKYLYKYCSENIIIKTNLIEPQIYKVGPHKIKIIKNDTNT